MQAMSVVPAFKERKDSALPLLMCIESRTRKQFTFEHGKKGLAHDVIEAVSRSADGRQNTGFAVASPEGDRGVLTALTPPLSEFPA